MPIVGRRISKDKIGDSNGMLSVKYVFKCIASHVTTCPTIQFTKNVRIPNDRIQLNHEETWTKALKFMLTNLKWCLAWVCKNDSS